MALGGFASGVRAEDHVFAATPGGYKCQTCPAFFTDSDAGSNQPTQVIAAVVGNRPDFLNRIYKTAGGTTIW